MNLRDQLRRLAEWARLRPRTGTTSAAADARYQPSEPAAPRQITAKLDEGRLKLAAVPLSRLRRFDIEVRTLAPWNHPWIDTLVSVSARLVRPIAAASA